jgi:hypothetical protein
MSKLITAKIDVTKIVKSLLFKGQKGTYLDLIIWVNDTPDKYGNDISIQQRTGKDDPNIYIGEGKFYVKKEPEKTDDKQGEYQKSGKIQTGAMSDISELPGGNDDSLPS